jgi:hypothetical protein
MACGITVIVVSQKTYGRLINKVGVRKSHVIYDLFDLICSFCHIIYQASLALFARASKIGNLIWQPCEEEIA